MRRFFDRVLCIALFACVALPVSADTTGGGITITPAFQDIVLDQTGQEVEFFATVTNDTTNPVTLRLSVLDFGSLDESGGVAFLGASNDLERKYSLASWMRPEKDVVTTVPGETQKIKVTIENRDSLGPGGHYGALTFTTEDVTQSDGNNNIAVKQLFSSLVFVKKIGGEIYSLDLSEKEFSYNLMRLPEKIRLRFRNDGNIHLVPRGIVTVTDPLGRLVAKGIINEESALILPETFRTYVTTLKPLVWSFIPGRYTMIIAYRFDGKDDFTTVTDARISMPPLFVGSILVMLGIVVYLYKRRNANKRSLVEGS